MPKYQVEQLDLQFQALADRTRRAVVERLVRGPASASELAKPFDMALPSFVQHLGVLERAGVVTSEKVGRVRTYQLAVGALVECGDWIGRQRLPAEQQLDRLGTYLHRLPPRVRPRPVRRLPSHRAPGGELRGLRHRRVSRCPGPAAHRPRRPCPR